MPRPHRSNLQIVKRGEGLGRMEYTSRRTEKDWRRIARKTRYKAKLALGFPKSAKAKLRYVTSQENLDLDNVTPFKAVTFRANSVYDPDDSVGVGQNTALGHGVYSKIYNHYVVLGSKITVKVLPRGIADGANAFNQAVAFDPIMIGCYLDDNNSPEVGTTADDLIASWRGNYKFISGSAESLGKSVKLVNTFSAKKDLCYKDPRDAQYQIGADCNTNPIEAMYFVIWGYNVEQSNKPAAVRLVVTIDYVVLYTERKELDMAIN